MGQEQSDVIAMIGFIIARLRDNRKIWDRVDSLIRGRNDEYAIRLSQQMERSFELEMSAIKILLQYNTFAPLFGIEMPEHLLFGLCLDLSRTLMKIITLIQQQDNIISRISLGIGTDTLQSQFTDLCSITLIIHDKSRIVIESFEDAVRQYHGELRMKSFESKGSMLHPLSRPRQFCNCARRFQMTDAASSSAHPLLEDIDCEDCRQIIPYYRSVRLSADNKRLLISQSLLIASHATSGCPDVGASLLCLPCHSNRMEKAFSTAMAFEEHMKEHPFYEIVNNEASDPITMSKFERLQLDVASYDYINDAVDGGLDLVDEVWKDLAEYTVPRSTVAYLRSCGITIQRLEYAIDEDIICEYHTLEIKRYPNTSEGGKFNQSSFLAFILKDLNTFVNTKVCKFKQLDPIPDASKWKPEAPVCCVLRMDVPSLNNTTFGLALVESSTTKLRFVTVKTKPEKLDEHPLSGIREIGISADGVFFTKSVTRCTQNQQNLSTNALEIHDRLWRGFMIRVEKWIDSHSGQTSNLNFVREVSSFELQL